MRAVSERGVPLEEHAPTPVDGVMPDWGSVHLFLEVVRRGSFRACAEHLGVSINHLRNRIEQLEHQMGAKLLTRHTDGVRTTSEGQRILDAALRMETAAFGLIRARKQVTREIAGTVTVSVTDGLGTFWLIPQLVEFQRAYPKLLIDLRCRMGFADVGRLEADIAIQLVRPTAPDLKVVRLGRQFISLYASRSYVDTYGAPRSREELLKHRLVFLVAEQGRGREYYDELFPGHPQTGFIAMQTNLSTPHYWAIANGVGIGWLPTYVAAFSGQLVPIDLGMDFPFDIWLTYHPEAAHIPRVRKIIDWTVATFDAQKFPWFRDEYMPSERLLQAYRGKPLANMFADVLGPAQTSSLMAFQKR